DVAVEDAGFAQRMAAQFEADLADATEIVLSEHRRIARTAGGTVRPRRRSAGSSSRAAAGTLRLFNTVGAALGNRRVLGRGEARVLLSAAIALVVLGAIALLWPHLFAWPLALILLWLGVGLAARYRRTRNASTAPKTGNP